MDGIGLLVAILVGAAVTVPIIAIVALVRANGARRQIEEYAYKLVDLRGEILDLRRELKQLAERVERAGTSGVIAAQTAVTEEVARAEEVELVVGKPAEQPVMDARVDQPAAAVFAEEEMLAMSADATELLEAEARVEVAAAGIAMLKVDAAAPAAEQEHAIEMSAAGVAEREDTVPAEVQSPVFKPAAVIPKKEEWAEPFVPAPPPVFASVNAGPPRKSWVKRLRTDLPLEEFLGMNFAAKAGIVLMVLGLAYLGQSEFHAMGHGLRDAGLYLVAAVLLGGGIWLEIRERYRLVGRAGIGGGWALLFFTTYALNHVSAMEVLSSNSLDCLLMLVVAMAMVAHTLRYRSQVVTGLAFLLAFLTISPVVLNEYTVYSLVSGVVLALGIAAMALKMNWFELELFGILACYGNHFYWLYKLYPDGVAGHAFTEFLPSAIILVLYWAIFRFSYIARRIETPRQESISTVAALVNVMLLMAELKYQSTHPELAFYALAALGGIEFLLGQLPITKRRRAAFTLLTVIGTLLVFAAVPFKFSGNNIALFWMIAAEALLIAGIVQLEKLFRWLGLVTAAVTGLLVVYESWGLVELRRSSEAPRVQDGVLLLACSLAFYLNSQYVARRWKELFEEFDRAMALAQSFIGWATAFLGVWAVFTADWTAIGWGALLLGAAFGAKKLKSRQLLVQAWMCAVAALVRGAVVNLSLDQMYPQHLTIRFVTVPLLAAIFYFASWLLAAVEDAPLGLRTVTVWAGTVLLAALAWVEMPQAWVAPVWLGLAIMLCLIGRRFGLKQFVLQEHALAVAAVAMLAAVNLDAPKAMERYIPLAGCAAALYAISRFCTLKDAGYRRPAAWLHTWAATGLLAALAWHEAEQPWLAVIWVAFALALAVCDRIFDVEEVPWQAHVLALMAVARAVSVNFFIEGTWRGLHLRLVTIGLVIAALYVLARWMRMPDAAKKLEIQHVYTWVAAGLASWLMWKELQPISLALGLGVFGLVLFEIGEWKKQRQLCWQAYALMAASFARIFFVNLTAAKLPGEMLSPRVYTVAPLALIYFYVWTRLESKKTAAEITRWNMGSLIAYFGSATIAALLYFEVSPEWIIVAWAVMALALIASALVLDKEVFLQQAVLLVAGIAGRGLAHNIYGSSYFVAGGWRGKFSVLSFTALLLLSTLPLAFKLRARYAQRIELQWLSRWLFVQRPEQIFFFVPVGLIVLTIEAKMNPGMVTLAWGTVGFAAILMGLLAGERSYRLTGLGLLLLCVGKILALDAWRLNERDRYITFIAVGASLTLVSMLYSRYRDHLKRLL